MNQSDLFDGPFPQTPRLGRIERDRGERATLAAEHQDWVIGYRRVVQDWMDRLPAGSEFTGENLTEAAWMLDEPHSPACWSANAGAMIRKWYKEGAITSAPEMKQARKVSSHARRYPTYRKL